MNYSTTHLNKELNDLNFEDLEKYFHNERVETDQLEFKSVRNGVLSEEGVISLRKSICALLNSSGGLIIIGAPEGIKIPGKKEKIFKGSLSGFNNNVEKDNLINRLSDGIIPLPNLIRLKIINHSGFAFGVIEVDPSEYAPHQTANVYYMRIDGQTKPAPHHYIEALFRRIKYPNVEAYLCLREPHHYMGKLKITLNLVFYNWSPLQNEEQLSFRVITDGIFESYRPDPFRPITRFKNKGHEYFKETAKDVLYYGEPVLETQALLFNLAEVGRNGNRARVLVTFGGRFSPMKSSEYTLDFSGPLAANADNMIIFKDENRLMIDVHNEKGMSKEKIIEKLMTVAY